MAEPSSVNAHVSGAAPVATYFPHGQVAAGFAKGMPLLEGAPDDRYRIHTSRREAPGIVEVHHRHTDIFYMQTGSATFVTGGEVVEPQTIGPGEVRGAAITGGTDHHLTAGDVIVVPPRTPHWFKRVDGLITYFTVKVAM